MRPSNHLRLENANPDPSQRHDGAFLFEPSIAAVIGMAVFFYCPSFALAYAQDDSQPPSVVHVVEHFSDVERRPGEDSQSEWWFVKGVGLARIVKHDGNLTYKAVWRDGMKTAWFPNRNEVTIEPAALPNFAPWFLDPNTLRQHVRMAKTQGIPISVQKILVENVEIRRTQIRDLVLDQQKEASLKMTVVVDENLATKRVVRYWTLTRAAGEKRDNYSTLNATHKFTIRYPKGGAVGDSIFRISYPDDAKIIKSSVPANILSDETKLKTLAKVIDQYLAENGDRFPAQWVSTLASDKLSRTCLITSDDTCDADALRVGTSWSFRHEGKKRSQLGDPDQVVIAEHIYRGDQKGYQLRLFASGRTQLVSPAPQQDRK